MAATKLLLGGVTLLSTLLYVVSAVQNSTTLDSNSNTVNDISNTTDSRFITDITTGRKDKKVDNMVNDMYTAFMMTKNMMSMMLMFVSPIIQIKGFGLSVVNTLINIGRFLLQMQSTKRLHEMAEMHHVHMKAQAGHVNHHHIEPMYLHKAHESPNLEHGSSPVYIVKDHDHDSWGDDNNPIHDHNTALTNEHDVTWAKEPDKHWKSTEHFFSAPNPDRKWSSPQKFAYYALPPATPFSSRLGEPLAASTSPQHSLPPARASYVSRDIVRHLYPHFSPNVTRFI